MEKNEQTWTHSELIYLFVDGEADDLQKTQLFSALPNNSELQAELADAIRINAAARDERTGAAPPAAVTGALFERAGIGVVAGSGSIVAVSSGGSGLVGGWFALKKVALPLIAGFLGATLALLFIPKVGVQNDASQVAGLHNELASIIAQESENKGIASVEKSKGLKDQNDIGLRSQGYNNSMNGSAWHSSDRSSFLMEEESRRSNGKENSSDVLPSSLSETEVSSLSHRPLLQRLAPRSSAPIGLAHPSQAEMMERIGRAAEQVDISYSRTSPRLSLQLRGILGLETFPNRSLQQSTGIDFENIAITALWHPSKHHGFGVEVGREQHPLYVQDNSGGNNPIILEITTPGGGNPNIDLTGNGGGSGDPNSLIPSERADNNKNYNASSARDTVNGYRLEQITEWAGLAYQFKANPIDRLGAIQPYVQTVVGATRSGPIGKAMVGLSWKPEDRISFGFGVEGTSLFYRRDGEWFSSRKLGATYSVQVEF